MNLIDVQLIQELHNVTLIQELHNVTINYARNTCIDFRMIQLQQIRL